MILHNLFWLSSSSICAGVGDEWLSRVTGYRADECCGPQCALLLSVLESLIASTGGIAPGEQGMKTYSFLLHIHSTHH